MPHDPVRVADTRAWFVKANNDLRATEVDLAATPPLVEDALFHCQQAVEKAITGLLTWHDIPFSMALAREVFQAILDRLPDDVRP